MTDHITAGSLTYLTTALLVCGENPSEVCLYARPQASDPHYSKAVNWFIITVHIQPAALSAY